MTKNEHLRFVLTSVNARMHDGPCPGTGSLGECAAITDIEGSSGHVFYVASLYLWKAALDLQAATVAAWFTEAGCANVIVSAVLHDPDNGTIDGVTSDGVWPWEVSFSLEGPHKSMAAPTPDQIGRAFEIADQAMFELLNSEGVPGDEHRTVFGFVDESCQEVASLAEASPAMRKAFEWLRERGYVELGEDKDGECVNVSRRPGEE